jgi:hypothetical protein
MTPDIARHLLLLVNSPNIYDMLCSYAEYRMKWITNQLATCPSWDETLKLQGQYKEMARMKSLRDEVNQGANDGRKGHKESST